MVYESSRYGDLAKKVIFLACLAAGLAILENITSFSSLYRENMLTFQNVATIMTHLLLALLIPACGYFGAKNADDKMLCCFCGCNFLSAFLSCCGIILGLTMMVAAVHLHNAVSECDPYDINQMTTEPCKSSMDALDSLCVTWRVFRDRAQVEQWTKNSTVIDNATDNPLAFLAGPEGGIDSAKLDPASQQQCLDAAQSSLSIILGFMAFSLCLCCCEMGMNCLSGIWGKQLLDVVNDGDYTDDTSDEELAHYRY
mmetsp:Transcript_123433/g.348760  ORF Transcript_123433/g.348760 Transcript_123433/m.348760 type:complete len:255 (+) Transcript_123433:79-843(+)